MKKLGTLAFIGATMLLISCGAEGDSKHAELVAKKAELEETIKTSNEELLEVEAQIAELDTTVEVKSLAKISVIKSENGVFDHYFEIQGAVVADRNVIVTPEVGGEIKKILVSEGQSIKKGDMIATFNNDAIASNVMEVKEQLELAKYMYEKQKSLYEKGVGTEIAVKQSETQYNALKQTLSSIRSQQGKFFIEAPFDGFVEEIFPVVGQVAGPGMPIIRLIDLTKMSVKADISESYLAKISGNSVANLHFPAIKGADIVDLPVKRVGKFVNPVNRTVTIEIDIPNPNEHHVPNLMSVIKVRDYIDTAAVVIPSRTILRDMNQDPYVFVHRKGKVHQVGIAVGLSSNNKTQVLSGLAAGEEVVDKGARGIKNNQEVEIK